MDSDYDFLFIVIIWFCVQQNEVKVLSGVRLGSLIFMHLQCCECVTELRDEFSKSSE